MFGSLLGSAPSRRCELTGLHSGLLLSQSAPLIFQLQLLLVELLPPLREMASLMMLEARGEELCIIEILFGGCFRIAAFARRLRRKPMDARFAIARRPGLLLENSGQRPLIRRGFAIGRTHERAAYRDRNRKNKNPAVNDQVAMQSASSLTPIAHLVVGFRHLHPPASC